MCRHFHTETVESRIGVVEIQITVDLTSLCEIVNQSHGCDVVSVSVSQQCGSNAGIWVWVII